MKTPNVTVYGSADCADTLRVRSFLDEQSVIYEYKDVCDDASYSDYVADLNGGKRILPTLRINNETLVNPEANVLEAAIAEATVEETEG